MRLFVAIDIEPHVRVRIKQIQNRLMRTLNLSERHLKWGASRTGSSDAEVFG